MTPDQKSLVQVYLGPFNTNITLAEGTFINGGMRSLRTVTLDCSGNKITAQVDTNYPFSDTLTTTIHAEKPFTYYIRIPGWVNNATISTDGKPAKAVTASNGLHAVSVSAGVTSFELNLPVDITIGEFGSELTP